MKDVIIDTTKRSCTCSKDVILLMKYQDLDNYWPSFSLYKIMQIDYLREPTDWIYYLLGDDDKYPIPITEKTAEDIIKQPYKGASLVLNRWFDRYGN